MTLIPASDWRKWRERFYRKPKATALGKAFVQEHGKDAAQHHALVNASDRAAEQYIEERFVQF